MGSDDWPDWLPGDWTMNIKKVDQRKVKCYIDPEGHKCYSKPQVLDHLMKNKKSIPDERAQNEDDSAIDLSMEPNALHTDEVPESSPGGHATKLTPRTSRRKPNYRDLSEEDLTGDDPSSEPLSSTRKSGDDSSWLPEGWTVEVKVRKGGSSTGMRYKMYTDPVSGQKFFSKPQVLNHLAKTNSSAGGQGAVFPEPISATPISAWKEKLTTELDNSEIHDATEVENKTKKKTESARLSSAHEVISRTPAEGLPPGWIKELRLRKHGLHKHDPFYIYPSIEYAFFSKKDVLRYLESGDVRSCAIKPLNRDASNDDTLNVTLTSPPVQSRVTDVSKDLTNGSLEETKTDDSGIQTPKPSRSITGGSFSTTKEENSDWLPDGWVVETRYKNSGMKYKIYKESATGKMLYSKPQVLSYLGNPGSSSKSRKRKENKSSVEPDSSPNPAHADAARFKRSTKKKAKTKTEEEYQEVITTAPAEGLPPGWIKETRTKIYATHKRNDPFYTDPVTGYIFRSKLDAMRFLESGDVNLCAMRPKVKDKDGNEVFVYTNDVRKPAAGKQVSEGKEGEDASTEIEDHSADLKTGDNTNRRVSTRVAKNSSPVAARSSKRGRKGKSGETAPPPTGTEVEEKQTTGVNLEKQPGDDGNLSFEIPDDDNWTDHCIDFAVKTLTNEIMFNGQAAAGSVQEEHVDGAGAGGVKESPQTKVN